MTTKNDIPTGPVSESELVAAANGERVSYNQVEDSISSEHYFTAANGITGAGDDGSNPIVHRDLGLLTFCVLRMQNGYTVYGSSACADPINYNAEIGNRLAREDAVRKIWPLLGYELKTKLAGGRS